MTKKLSFSLMITLFAVWFAGGLMPVTAQITHNISSGSLTVSGSSNYIITGTSTTNRVTVNSGYTGTITLRNLTITSSSASPIAVLGQNNRSALSPVTRVNVILEGVNTLTFTGTGYAAFQVDQGAQISISAIDPGNDASGTLNASSTSVYSGGAGIGAIATTVAGSAGNQGTATIVGSCSGMNPGNVTAGGNIIISSGTINAQGAHGAGIGGAHFSYYNGIIAIYGGIVDSRAGYDAAGIGSGCPHGTGIIGCYAPQSAIIVLPPAKITAYGAGANSSGGVGTIQFPELGLAGTAALTYIGDPNKPLITVRTETYEKNAAIYADLTETPSVASVFTALAIPLTLNSVKFGYTNSSGLFTFNAQLNDPVTFFTDASSTVPASLGRPFKPQRPTSITTPTTIILPLLNADISFEATPSTPLQMGYLATDALTNSYMLKVIYADTKPMTGVVYEMQGAASSQFVTPLQFFSDAAGTTVIPTPTTLTAGTTFYIRVPIKTGYPIGVYTDVLRFSGTYDGGPTGWIRQVVTQRVVFDDTNTNTYIKVTANPPQFATNTNTATVELKLNITHGTSTYPYDNTDVTAKYLISTIKDYDLALAAEPLTSSAWTNLNIPATDGVDRSTTAAFTGKPEGTYYIHWYVTSGVVYAHSKTVIGPPPATYGGFGPYIIDTTAPAVAITVGGENATKNITALGALPVTITFSEDILNAATALTTGSFTIAPVSPSTVSGTISNIQLVSGTLNSYTADLTPSSSLASGASFTILVNTGAVKDLAGNNNTVSNTVTVTFSNTAKPAVTFNNAAAYSTLQPTFTVSIDPGDAAINSNTSIFSSPGTVIANGSNLNALFTITPSGPGAIPINTSNYSASYNSTTNVVTFTFTSGALQNSTEYTIAIANNKVYNLVGNGNDAGSSTFKIAVPNFTGALAGITASPNLFDNLGGNTTLTLKGEGLKMNAEDGRLSLHVECAALSSYVSGPVTSFTVVSGMDEATIPGVVIPANTTSSTITYTFELFMTFNSITTNTGKTCIVEVEPATSYIVKVTNNTLSVNDLTYGYTLATAQTSGYIQLIEVENMGVLTLNNLLISFTGTDGDKFDYMNLSPSTGLAAGNKATFAVYLKTGQNAGTYAVTGAATPTNVVVTATQASTSATLNGKAALVQQKVVQAAGSSDKGLVTGLPEPSVTWINNSTIQLTPSATATGDAVKNWRYAVVTGNSRPAPLSSDWSPLQTGSGAVNYNVPANTDGVRYIFWEMETTNYYGIEGQVINAAGTVVEYNIDNIAPTVTSITSSRTVTNATPFDITVTFSEPVGTIDASRFVATNATVSAITGTSTAIGGRYDTYVMTLTPNTGLSDGSIINFSVAAAAAKDKATNNNTASPAAMNVNITFNSVRPIPTLTTPKMKTNADFVVTVVFTKPITGLDPSHFSVLNGFITPGSLTPVLTSPTYGTTYTFTVNTSTSLSGLITITLLENMVADASGNKNVEGKLIVDFVSPSDKIAAVLSYSGPTWENGAFNVYVAFSRNVTGLTATDFNHNVDLTPTLTGAGKNYTLTLTPAANVDNTTTVTLKTVIAARDEYGNELNGSNTVTANYDTRRPLVVSITQVTPAPEVNFDPFDLRIIFNEAPVSGFDPSKLIPDGLTYLSLVSGPVVSGTSTEYVIRVQVAPGTLSGSTLRLDVGEGTVKDKAGNPNVSSLTSMVSSRWPGVRFTDNVPPFVVSMSPSGNWAPIKGNLVFTFNEDMDQSVQGKVWLEDFGLLTGGTWLDERTLSFPYGYLKYWATYQVYVYDFRDLAGNIQDPVFSGVIYTGAPIRPVIQREIILFAGGGLNLSITPNVVHYVVSTHDFVFDVTAKPGYNLNDLHVTSGDELRDKEGGITLTKNDDGSVTVTIKKVQETLFITVTIGPLANETIETTKVWAYDHNLYVQSDQLATLRIHTMDGQLYRRMPVQEGITTIPLPRGIYTVLIDLKPFKIVVQ